MNCPVGASASQYGDCSSLHNTDVSTLPFTGMEIGLVFAIAVALILIGLAIRLYLSKPRAGNV